MSVEKRDNHVNWLQDEVNKKNHVNWFILLFPWYETEKFISKKEKKRHHTVGFGLMNREIQKVNLAFMVNESHSNDLTLAVHGSWE